MTDYTSLDYTQLFTAYDRQSIVKAVVGEVSGRGHQVFVLGFPAFLPVTQEVPGESAETGQEVEVCIIKMMPETNNIVVSARVAAEKKASDEAEKLEVGQVVTARIKSLTKYGAFASVGGADGLIHITELSYNMISDPSEVVAVGQEIPVKILNISEPNEKGKRKIELSYKQVLPNPWESLSIKAGDLVDSTVDRITDFGLFFSVEGVQAMVHRSELSWIQKSPEPKDLYKVGDPIHAKILSIDIGMKKIAASVRETTENPWDTLTLEPGDVVETVITNKTKFGFFITVAEGIEGLIHNNELAWTNIEKKAMMESLSVGDTVKAVLLEIDKGNHRLSFSIKHLTQPPFHA